MYNDSHSVYCFTTILVMDMDMDISLKWWYFNFSTEITVLFSLKWWYFNFSTDPRDSKCDMLKTID